CHTSPDLRVDGADQRPDVLDRDRHVALNHRLDLHDRRRRSRGRARGVATAGSGYRHQADQRDSQQRASRHRFPSSVKTSSRVPTIVWHANPHLASFPCGGVAVMSAGLNVSDAVSYLKAPHPHPPLSANRLLSFTMKSTSCKLAGTVAVGSASSFFGFQWTFAILTPSGRACRCRECRTGRP